MLRRSEYVRTSTLRSASTISTCFGTSGKSGSGDDGDGRDDDDDEDEDDDDEVEDEDDDDDEDEVEVEVSSVLIFLFRGFKKPRFSIFLFDASASLNFRVSKLPPVSKEMALSIS